MYENTQQEDVGDVGDVGRCRCQSHDLNFNMFNNGSYPTLKALNQCDSTANDIWKVLFYFVICIELKYLL